MCFSCSPSPAENANIKQECDNEAVKASKGDDSDAACADNVAESTEDYKDTRKSNNKKQKQARSKTNVPYPEPRLPVPCMSSLTSDEQKRYVSYLMNRNTREPPQVAAFRDSSSILLAVIALLFEIICSNISELKGTSKRRSDAVHKVPARCG